MIGAYLSMRNFDIRIVIIIPNALQLFDKVSKAANIRQQNLDKHCDRRMEAHKNEPETVEKYDKMGPYMKILLLIVSLNRVENCIIFIKTAVSKLTS